MTQESIRDLIYFDIEKASSILSQFDWGLIEQISITQDEIKTKSGEVKASVPQIASVGLGGNFQNKQSILETKKLHHDLLNRVESQLINAGLVIDFTSLSINEIIDEENIHKLISDKPYIKAQGWGFFEDYQRIYTIIQNFNELYGFITQSQLQNLKNSNEYREIELEKDNKWQEIKKIKDPNIKQFETQKFKLVQEQMDQKIKEISQQNGFEQWMVDGIKKIVESFMHDRIVFRIYPYESIPNFQIESNLKKESFVDQNLEYLLYGYGSKPNMKLSVFGLITSNPAKDNLPFDPLENVINNSTDFGLELPFRQFLSFIDNFESSFRRSYYPSITIHPIAVFREFLINKEKGSQG